jgi:5-methylcytosine-specific restriction endonuclease McrA
MAIKNIKPSINTIDTRQGSSPAVERIRGYRLVGIRQRISLRDEYTCQLCGRVTAQGQVDHKTPLHLGGAESDENRQWVCTECHEIKSAEEEKGRGK